MFIKNFFFSIIFSTSILIQFSFAELSKSLNIVVIDIQYILKNSKPSLDFQKTLDRGREIFQKNINEEEKALREAERLLNLKREEVDDNEFKELVKEFEKKLENIQGIVQKSRQELEQSQQNFNQIIIKTIEEIVQKISLEKEIDIVLKSDSTFYNANSIDLTDEVLKEINLKQLNFNFKNMFIKTDNVSK